MKSFDYEFVITSQWQQKEWRSKYSTDFVKAFIHSYTRKLIESLAEEIENKIKKHSASLPIDIERHGGQYCQGMHAGLDLAIDTVIQQRLKVKEIINQISK